MSRVPHTVFVHQELFSGKPVEQNPNEPEPEYLKYVRSSLHQPSDETRNAVNQLLESYGITFLTYNTNAELTLLASTFITESQDGLLFRIYVPSGRLWANETDRLVALFRDYLTRIAGTSVRLDQQRTAHGIVYEFFQSGENAAPDGGNESLALQFREFLRFLDLSVSDPEQAEAVLLAKNIDPQDVVPILTRYAKEARRLQVDLKHEREQKVLAIQQRLESELVDSLPSATDWNTISQLVNAAVPPYDGVKSLVSSTEIPRQIGSRDGTPSVTFNFQPQIVQAVNAVVAEEIEGDVHLTQFDKELLNLIVQRGGENTTELKSAVHELADPSAPSSHRLLAKETLKTFLLGTASVAKDVGTGLLLSYLEKRYGLK